VVLMLAGIDDPKLIALPRILPRLAACLAVSCVIPGTLSTLCRRLWSRSVASVHTAHASFTSTVGQHSSLFRFRLRFRLRP